MRKLIVISILLGVTITGRADQSYSSNVTASNLPQYDLSIKILPEAHRLEGNGTIKLPATNAARETVQLALSELMTEVAIEVIAPAASAGTPKLEKKERPFGRPGWATVVWTIRPSTPFPAGEPVVLKFTYAGGGDRTSFAFYLGPVCSFGVGILTAWYPVLEDEPKIQLRGLRGTGMIHFSVPAGYKAHSEGKLISRPDETERGNFRFRIDTPSTFSFGIAKYITARHDGPIPVSIYLLQPRPNVDEYLKGTARVLEALVREFGPFPYSEFAILEVPADIDAGFSGVNADGFILTIGETFDGRFKTAHYAHEISHSWWGAIVQRKGPRGYHMLDEAMAQYGSLRAVEMIEGLEAAEQYRRTGYPSFSDEYCGFTYLMRTATGFDHRLADLPLETQFMNARVADSKGMLVWDLLSRTVGRAMFSQILQDITRQYAFRRVTWEEFLGAIQKGSGKDLSWFYEQWFERTGAPDWQLTWKQEGQNVKGAVTQLPPYYRAEVEVRIDGDDCATSVRKLSISGAKTEFVWPVKFKVKSITLDPHFLVLHWTPEYRAQSAALLPYTKGDLLYWEGKNEAAVKEFKEGLERVPELDQYGLRFLLEYGIGRTLNAQEKFKEARDHMQAAIASPKRRIESLPWAYFELARSAQKMNDQSLFKWAIDGVITSDAAAGGRTGAVDQALSLKRNGASSQ